MAEEIKFPGFYFESGLYFGKIKSREDLNDMFKAWEGQMDKVDILDKTMNIGGDDMSEFGLRPEHIGPTTLRQFLSKHKIRFRR